MSLHTIPLICLPLLFFLKLDIDVAPYYTTDLSSPVLFFLQLDIDGPPYYTTDLSSPVIFLASRH